MEWVLGGPQIHSTFASLGYLEGDVYHANDDCLSSLKDIYTKLNNEDRNLRAFRRTVGFGQSIQKDIIPILINVKDVKILDLTIKILVNLTVPVECLLSIDEMCKTNAGRHTIVELNNLLRVCKECFKDYKVAKSILDYVNTIFDSDGKISPTDAENVNNCLLLIRNILHIPDVKNPSNNQGSLQNQILWNLFTSSIDRTLLHLISSPHGSCWSVTIVQLIALIYKDQHIGTLQRLLNLWFEASLSDSSDDNESNTPPDQGNDSPLLTSDPTSDSSDNGCSGNINDIRITKLDTPHLSNQTQINNAQENEKSPDISRDENNAELITSNSAIITNRLKGKRGPITPLSHLICSGPNTSSKRECTSANSEFSDCGYVTQIENRESATISSNEDEDPQDSHVHQKPHAQKQRHNKIIRPLNTIQDKNEKRRKRLVKRGRTSIINMKGLIHHTPTDDDITNVLKEFTVDFLLKGYGSLVKSLHYQLIYNVHLQIDTSHFFWLLTYFMKFAAQLELDLDFVKHVLSFDIISYLTYEGVNLCEQIQLISKFNNSDLKSCLRRIHLVITAIREFIQTIDIYKKISHLNDEDRMQLDKLQLNIASTEDLRCLFVLLLRHYQPDIHSKQYLQDLIVTNHILLTFLDNTMILPDSENTILMEHMQQFATVEVMHQYGLLLQDYQTNGEFVNDCIFTMMHHVTGDLKCVSTLYQPNILKVILTMWETGFELCTDWSDLIAYVINSFMKNPKTPSKSIKEEDIDAKTLKLFNSAMEDADGWSEEEIDSLHWNYMQSCQSPNVIESMRSLYREDGIEKSPMSIVKQLYRRNIIHDDEYRILLASTICVRKDTQIYLNSPNNTVATRDEIENLKSELERQNMHYAIVWLQNVLLETCYSKIRFNSDNNKYDVDDIIPSMEPITYHNILINQSVPIIPWNNEQTLAIHNQTFLILLQRLGLLLPIDSGKLFVRIPNYWTPEVLFGTTIRLGPFNQTSLKFSIKRTLPEQKSTSSPNADDFYVTDPKYVGPIYFNKGGLYTMQHNNKTTSTIVEITEIISSFMSASDMKTSTDEENNNIWLNKPGVNGNQYQTEKKSDHIKEIKVEALEEHIEDASINTYVTQKSENVESIPCNETMENIECEISSANLNSIKISDDVDD